MLYVETDTMDVYRNFATEYYLMAEKRPKDTVLLFWRTTPTVMVGKYQNTLEEINSRYVQKHGIQVVRRLSGGGTIYTDPGGWQFSFISPPDDENGEIQICFDRYLPPILKALRKLGLPVEFNGRNDLLIEGRKFSGNAQYIHDGYTVHHGSLLYDTDISQMVHSTSVSDYKIISKGIQSVRERVTNLKEHLCQPLSPEEFKRHMVLSISGCEREADLPVLLLSEKEKSRIQEIEQERFRSPDFIYGRNPRCTFFRCGHFSGGNVEIGITAAKGKILDCTFTGDLFGTLDSEEICAALRGLPLEREPVLAALQSLGVDEGGLYRVRAEELADCLFP